MLNPAVYEVTPEHPARDDWYLVGCLACGARFSCDPARTVDAVLILRAHLPFCPAEPRRLRWSDPAGPRVVPDPVDHDDGDAEEWASILLTLTLAAAAAGLAVYGVARAIRRFRRG